MTALLFVYGTLQRGGTNHAHLQGGLQHGHARLRGPWELIALEDYPGLVEAPGRTGAIWGEVWEVTEAHLSALDEFEGLPEGLYRRERVTVEAVENSSEYEAWTYIYARSSEGRARVGDRWSLGLGEL